MNNKTTHIVLGVMLVVAVFASAYAYTVLPDRVASHWNASGVADGYMGKFWGMFLLPLIMVGVFLLYLVIPKIDPMKANIESFRGYYNGFWVALFAFFLYIHKLTLAWNLGYRFNFATFMVPALAVLWFFIGIFLEHSKRNWFVGIRTPWTLSSDVVWNKTHALGGKLFKLAAVVSLAGLVVPGEVAILAFVAAPAFAIALVTIVYSYIVYRQEDR